jgi:hypothetical protein
LDGGGGHTGKRSFDVVFGLGQAGGAPVSADINWRDRTGSVHHETVKLAAGVHTLCLDHAVMEVPTR